MSTVAARSAPRVIQNTTNMARAASNLPARKVAPGTQPEALERLRIFASVPSWHGVIAVAREDACALFSAGEVVVYEENKVECEGIIADAIYVIEYQTTRHGADPDNYRRIDRHIRRISPSSRDPEQYYIHPLRGSGSSVGGVIHMSDGPLPVWHLGDRIRGRVVGIYNPIAIAKGGTA